MATNCNDGPPAASAPNGPSLDIKVFSQLPHPNNEMMFPALPVTTSLMELKTKIAARAPGDAPIARQRLIHKGPCPEQRDSSSLANLWPRGRRSRRNSKSTSSSAWVSKRKRCGSCSTYSSSQSTPRPFRKHHSKSWWTATPEPQWRERIPEYTDSRHSTRSCHPDKRPYTFCSCTIWGSKSF